MIYMQYPSREITTGALPGKWVMSIALLFNDAKARDNHPQAAQRGKAADVPPGNG